MLENIGMELTKENIRKILLIIFACILFSWALNNIAAFGVVLSGTWKLLAPFIIGGMIAFVMNIPMVSQFSTLMKMKVLGIFIPTHGGTLLVLVATVLHITMIKIIVVMTGLFLNLSKSKKLEIQYLYKNLINSERVNPSPIYK